MLKVVQDLKSYDACKIENSIKDSNMRVEMAKGAAKDSIISELKKNNSDYKANLDDCKTVNTTYQTVVKKQQQTITGLEAKVTIWKIVTGAATGLALLSLIL